MKRTILGLVAAFLTCYQATAQQTAFVPGKLTDNWQLGINGGVDAVTLHNEIIYNLNPRAGIRLTRFITPVLGVALQGSASFRNKPFPGSNGIVKASNLDLLTLVNISNLLKGYQGQPRRIEVSALVGLGWGHLFGLKAPRLTVEQMLEQETVQSSQMDKNAFMGKLAFDVAYSLGHEREWQIYLEPGINYHLDANGDVQVHLGKSSIALMAGINYRFPNSDGRRHMSAGQLRSQQEIDDLNQQVNELRADLKTKEAQLARDERQLRELKDRLEKLGDIKPSNFDLNE
jgi:hypothetical protein